MSRAGRKHAAARAAAVQLSPLTDFMQRIFLDEIYEQCTYVLRAAEELGRALNELARITAPLPNAAKLPAEAMAEMTTAWYAIQNLIVAAATISRLLWGDYEANTQEQRRPLRKLLAVTQTSPLKKRSLRNHLEHIDTRIIAMFEDPTARNNYVSRSIGPATAVRGAQTPRFSYYDPDTGLLTFWRDSVSLPDLLAEVQRILPLAEAARRRR